MDIRKLDVFCKVVELKSFTRAARAVFLSQPTVSDHVRHLEEELGQKLVDRLGREAEPTPAGRLLYDYASRILRLQQETLEALARFGGRLSGETTIGASTIPATYILPALVGTFRAAHPEVTVSVRISGSHEIARKVLAGEYDLGLVGAMWNERGLDWTELFTDTLVLVARPDHPLAGRGPVTLDDLCGQDYVGREPGSGTRKVIGALLETAGRRETDLHQVALFGANEAVREAVKAGVGVSMLSRRSVAADLAAGALVEIPLKGVSGERPFYLLRRRNRQLPPSAAALAEHLVAAAARDQEPAPG